MTEEHLIKRAGLLQEGLLILAGSKLNESLILEGGAALHFVYHSPRYSDDIDFVDDSLLRDVEGYLAEVLEIGKKYADNTGKVMPSRKGIRVKWGHELNGPKAVVEIDSRACEESCRIDPRFDLKIKTLGEIYTDKIVANAGRYKARKECSNNPNYLPIKPTDFFDILYITEHLGQIPVEKERVLRRARAFDSESVLSSQNLGEVVDLINNEEKHDLFRDCMRRSMAPEDFKKFCFDRRYFERVADNYRKYII